mmetsp:Transcript_39572/g.33421  ORF Transcript_39572/g.33421 Transcript_39572/m.33421 type:complete len:145 (+) Transcript_39572:58-492(+)
MKYAALLIAGMAASASAFAPGGISLRAPCTIAATCVRQTNGDGSYRDDQGNLRDEGGNVVQAGSGRGNDADVAASYFAQKKKDEEATAAAAAAPKLSMDMSGDSEAAAWKLEKEQAKKEQEAATEAKMAMWMKAAADKKAAEGK